MWIRKALAGLVMAATWATIAQAQKEATGQRDILLQTEHAWNGTKYTHYPTGTPQITVLKLTIAPHTALPWHTHPFPNSGYVLSGELTIQDRESGKRKTIHAGEAFAETVNDVHRGVSGDTPTVLILTYAGVAGTPTSIPVKGGRPEY
jgi:quercetin dioxygenase-like cupin family protein